MRSRVKGPDNSGGGEVLRAGSSDGGNWVKKWKKDHPEAVDVEASSEQSAENRRLRAELREARMEIEFLKKAASFFAQESR